jgi:hypothetical protein
VLRVRSTLLRPQYGEAYLVKETVEVDMDCIAGRAVEEYVFAVAVAETGDTVHVDFNCLFDKVCLTMRILVSPC